MRVSTATARTARTLTPNFSDEFNHLSIREGIRNPGADRHTFRHGDLEHLETLLCKSSRPHSGYLIYFRILSRAGATNVMLVTFLMPVSTILLGILILGEHVTLRHLAGLAIIAVGLAAIDGRAANYLGFTRRSYS
jgi:EamA-like transporter family